jgi:hypothetical protein
MNELKEIIDDGYGVFITKGKCGYYVSLEKQHAADDFEEYETQEYASIEEAVTIAYKYAQKGWNW